MTLAWKMRAEGAGTLASVGGWAVYGRMDEVGHKQSLHKAHEASKRPTHKNVDITWSLKWSRDVRAP